jgi:hypothetical protein
VRGHGAPDQAAVLRPVDQAGHAGLVQAEVPCQLLHAGAAVAQDAEQAQLDDRHSVFGGHLAQDALHRERELNQAVHDPQVGNGLHGAILT